MADENSVVAYDSMQEGQHYQNPLIALKGISKYFGGVQALENVSMEIYPSEVVALVGDNGAGKSTFLKVISGVNIPDSGTIEINGEPVHIRNTRDPVKYGIQTVYQDLALCDNLSIIKNMFLGREIKYKTGRLAAEEMESIARKCLNELGIEVGSLHTPVGQLSGGQRQAVAIARSMLGNPKVVLLDEPLANLGLIQRRQVSELIKRLKGKGYGVVVVSHDLIEVFEVADRVVVLRLGKKVAEINRDEITHEGVVAEITGTDNFLDDE
jgi:D-xylose transport system ATP-binding protein